MSVNGLIAKIHRTSDTVSPEQLAVLQQKVRGCHFRFKDRVDARDVRFRMEGYRTGDVLDAGVRPARGSKGVEVWFLVVFHEFPRTKKVCTGHTRAYVVSQSVQLSDRCPQPVPM